MKTESKKTPTINSRQRRTTIFDPEICKKLKLEDGIQQEEQMLLLKMENEKELHELKKWRNR
ncbi:Protein of unknown function [Gryllus bimaculatus]|nr:Protein of unknown function [Gryllus bimaculatus]